MTGRSRSLRSVWWRCRTWRNAGGVLTPEYIDNEQTTTITGLELGIHSNPPNFCTNLRKFIVFFSKPDNTGVSRWYARVRD